MSFCVLLREEGFVFSTNMIVCLCLFRRERKRAKQYLILKRSLFSPESDPTFSAGRIKNVSTQLLLLAIMVNTKYIAAQVLVQEMDNCQILSWIKQQPKV